MRVLLLHPEDVPWRGEWATSRWDLIVDLGFAGTTVYPEWSQRTGARVISLHQFAGQTESYRWVGQALGAGRKRFLDRMGLDWWEILASWSYHELQALYLLEQLRQELGPRPVEVVATRDHLSCSPAQSGRGLGRYGALMKRFRHRVVWYREFPLQPEICGPRKSSRSRSTSGIPATGSGAGLPSTAAGLKEPAVLLPSAYSNVTRVQLAYAAAIAPTAISVGHHPAQRRIRRPSFQRRFSSAVRLCREFERDRDRNSGTAQGLECSKDRDEPDRRTSPWIPRRPLGLLSPPSALWLAPSGCLATPHDHRTGERGSLRRRSELLHAIAADPGEAKWAEPQFIAIMERSMADCCSRSLMPTSIW